MQLLDTFQQINEEASSAFDHNFNVVPMIVKKFVHKTGNGVQAIEFKIGSDSTLAFYDSTIVDGKKLLPASPSSMPKKQLEENERMKNEIERMKAELEKSK